MHKKILIIISLATCYLLLATNTRAIDMSSSTYKIKYGNINIGAEGSTSPSYSLSTTVGQTAAGEFTSQGYTVKAGFQYWHAIVPFTFSISTTNINLGTLSANSPSTVDATLSVSFGGAGNYQVTAIEEGKLRTMNGNSIPNTSCNSTVNPCTIADAKLWDNNATYGFGYKMADEDIPQTFIDCGVNCYRPFPDNTTTSPTEAPEVVMSSENVTVDLASKPKDIIHQATITFKANVSPVQEAGSYHTVVNFVATPTF
jgi:hypothetical protein